MQVNLKRNGWHRRLQEYIFDDPPTFNSLCPYFWFTVFCLISSPLVFLGKSVVMPVVTAVGSLIEAIISGINKTVCIPLYESQLFKSSEAKLLDMYRRYERFEREKYAYSYQDSGNYKKDSKALQRFKKFREVWMKKHNATIEEFENQVAQALRNKLEAERKALEQKETLRRQKEEANAAREAAKAESREKVYQNIIKYTKWLAIPVAVCVASLVLYALYFVVSWMVSWDWAWIGVKSLQVLALLLGIVLLVVLFMVIKKIIEKCDLQMPSFAWVGKFGRGFINLIKRFGGSLGAGVASVLDFFIDYAKAAKEDYCPMIKWED